jgi:hypothetical protein
MGFRASAEHDLSFRNGQLSAPADFATTTGAGNIGAHFWFAS